MKKSLVLAMAMALGVTASAYAANPFSDVPAGHWAYDSISKLAAAGVIEGYGDSTFGGDKLMTRYEMAQIVAKAMAKGANVDKLAAEFAEELDNLGVRVANLEKKADNVKIAGNIRYEYAHRSGDKAKTKGAVAKNRLRSRLYVSGQVNDDWTYTARLENNQEFNGAGKNNVGEEETKLNQAWVNGKLGGLKVVAGKTDLTLANGNLYDDTAEYVGISYGKEIKLNAYWGQPVDYGYDEFWGINASGKIGKLGLSAGYDQFKDALAAATNVGDGKTNAAKLGADNGVWNITASYGFDKNVKLSATYLHSDLDSKDVNMLAGVTDVDTDGYVISLGYKGAKANQVGSWGANANYYNQGVGTFVAHTMNTGDWGLLYREGFKGYSVGANYTLAKNIVYSLNYYDLEGKETSTDTQVLWSRLQVTF